MNTMASQITVVSNVYSTVYSAADQTKHQRSTSLAFVRVIHRWPVKSPHKGPVTLKIFSFDDAIMCTFYNIRATLLEWGPAEFEVWLKSLVVYSTLMQPATHRIGSLFKKEDNCTIDQLFRTVNFKDIIKNVSNYWVKLLFCPVILRNILCSKQQFSYKYWESDFTLPHNSDYHTWIIILPIHEINWLFDQLKIF